MVVAEDNVCDAREINFEVTCVPQHRVRMSTCVEEDALTVNFYKGRKSPLADPSLGKHCREYKHTQRSNARLSIGLFRCCLRIIPGLTGRRGQSCDENKNC